MDTYYDLGIEVGTIRGHWGDWRHFSIYSAENLELRTKGLYINKLLSNVKLSSKCSGVLCSQRRQSHVNLGSHGELHGGDEISTELGKRHLM